MAVPGVSVAEGPITGASMVRLQQRFVVQAQGPRFHAPGSNITAKKNRTKAF
jgi:hypothetical protein